MATRRNRMSRKIQNKHTRKHKKYHGGDDIMTTEVMTQPTEELVIEEQPAPETAPETAPTATNASLTDKLKGHFRRARSYLASLTGGRKTKRVRKHTKTHNRKQSLKRKHKQSHKHKQLHKRKHTKTHKRK